MSRALEPLVLEPLQVERVWGGSRFGGTGGLIGESWIVADQSLIRRGPGEGGTLVDAVNAFGEDLIGSTAWNRGERSFPLLIKLVDVAEWLSIQVHPTDKQVEEIEGAPGRGKTEAWFVIDAQQGAEIIAGIRPGLDHNLVLSAIRAGSIEPLMQRHQVAPYDTISIPSGTMHALGPGIFIYEIQQHSDITYRAYDWGRPASSGRALHIDEVTRVTNLDSQVTIRRQGRPIGSGQLKTLTNCDYFTLRGFQVGQTPVDLDPAGETFHCVTAIQGHAVLAGAFPPVRIGPLESVLVPASAGAYQMTSEDESFVLAGSVV